MGALPPFEPHLDPPRFLTPDAPGTGGRLRDRIEDFIVDEIPAYEPSGDGEHAMLLVEKRNLSTLVLVRLLATHFGVRHFDVGYAGLKDRRAITRQAFTIWLPRARVEDFPAIRDPRVSVLWADRHANKLRRGHLAGNRFSIRIRGVEVRAVLTARAVLDSLARSGVPNRCAEQRFGTLLNNHRVGRAILLEDPDEVVRELLAPSPAAPPSQAEARAAFDAGDFRLALDRFSPNARTERNVLRVLARGGSPRDAARAISRDERSFFVTAFQSAIFNDLLNRRLAAGSLASLRPGDIAFKHDNGALFDVDDGVVADPSTPARLADLLVSPSGPMWGKGMKRARPPVDADELDALQRTSVSLDHLARFDARLPGLIDGARRPFRVPLRDPQVEAGVDEHGSFIRCAFELPRGAFATAVMREIMKPAPGTPAPELSHDEPLDTEPTE